MSKKTTTILILNPSTRIFLKKLGFPDIPDDANYCAFYDGGEPQFFEDFDVEGLAIPRVAALTYYDNLPLKFE